MANTSNPHPKSALARLRARLGTKGTSTPMTPVPATPTPPQEPEATDTKPTATDTVATNKGGTGITELVFIIDESGSMTGLEADTVGGINSTLNDMRDIEGICLVSVVFFDNTSRVILDRVPIEKVKPLTAADYHPGACTALLDAVGAAVKYHEKAYHILPADHRADNYVFVIITDGYENASHAYTYDDVSKMINQAKERGWEFLFLGANIDAAKEAARFGIAPSRASNYVSDDIGSAIAYESVTRAAREMRTQGSVSDTWAEAASADAERRGKRRFFR